MYAVTFVCAQFTLSVYRGVFVYTLSCTLRVLCTLVNALDVCNFATIVVICVFVASCPQKIMMKNVEYTERIHTAHTRTHHTYATTSGLWCEHRSRERMYTSGREDGAQMDGNLAHMLSRFICIQRIYCGQ